MEGARQRCLILFQMQENSVKVFKQENEWHYPCFKELTLEGKSLWLKYGNGLQEVERGVERAS